MLRRNNGRRFEQSKNNKQLTWRELYSLNQELLRQCPQLRADEISKQIQEAVHDNTVDQLFDLKNGRCELTPTSYVSTLKILLFAEEYYESVEMRKHDKYDEMLDINDKFLPRIRLHGLSKGQPSLIPKDLVVLKNNGQREACEIVRFEGDDIVFKHPAMHINKTDRLEVAFVSTGQTYQRYHETLEGLSDQKGLVRRIFFDEDLSTGKLFHEPLIDVETCGNDALNERLAKCNERQRQAIVGILEAKCRPKPYILFGPPGTGKSFTLVEAVAQICGRSSRNRILVCSNSNNCADQLAVALQREEISGIVGSSIRLSSQAHHESGGVKGVEITDLKRLHLRGIHNYRVIVTTNNMAGALRDYKFNYVFVDEAGHGHEAEILVPASCVSYDGLLVLAGDPKQLGPVIHNPQVEKLGLGQSMLERMFQFGVYTRDPDEGYDNNYITKLTVCYRCDPRILELSNNLFYHDELHCLGKTPPSLLRKLNISHPLLFCLVHGSEDKIQSSTSIRNQLEAEKCVDIIMHLYKMGIDPERIGVISFYTLQQKLIRAELIKRLKLELAKIKSAIQKSAQDGDNLDYLTIKAKCETKPKVRADNSKAPVRGDQNQRPGDDIHIPNEWICKVDTVDGFQGNEREIIIISTVRCSDPSSDRIERSGFLADSKRFNVAFSRAKWLALVVGHPAILDCHANWREFKKHQVEYKFNK